MKINLTTIIAIFYFSYWFYYQATPFKPSVFIWFFVGIIVIELILATIADRISKRAKETLKKVETLKEGKKK